MNKLSNIYYALLGIYYNLVWFFKNVYSFRKELCEYRTWDSGYSLMLLSKSLKDIDQCMFKNGRYDITGKNRRKLREAINIIDRLVNDDYILDQIDFDLELVSDNGNGRQYTVHSKKKFDLPTYSYVRRCKKKEVELSRLCSLLDKHLLTWWD